MWTGAACSYGCSTCPIPAGAAGVALTDLQLGLTGVPAKEERLAVLVGGEPFLRPEFLRLLAVVRAAGCVPGIVTSGRPLIYPQLRERLRRARVAYLRVQLFGVGSAHENTTAVSGSFEQALAGLRAWVEAAGDECDVDVALSTRGRSLEAVVDDIEQLAPRIPPGVQIVIAVDPAAREALPDETALRRMLAATAHWNDDPKRPLLVWEGLPESLSSAVCATVAPLRPAFVGSAPRATCLGPVADIVRTRAARRPQVQSNSFNFVRSAASVAWTPDAASCAAHAAAVGTDPHRSLWLHEGDVLAHYATDTGDFARDAIVRVKEEWSHLFVDRAAAGVLDDFTEGMRRVLPDPLCETCAHRRGCGRRFEIVDGPPFAREEAWIASYVAGLRGHVFDVGCGEQLYREQIGALLRAGDIEYTGLDPDEISLSHVRAALPQGQYHLGGIEDFRGEPASYDHILCLRSLNHVVDVDEAMARMAALLKPGGMLLLVETTPFAMLRQAEQVVAADQAPRAGHQHLRNLAGEEVLPFARRRALQILEHHPVGRKATNEWILLLQRAAKVVPPKS